MRGLKRHSRPRGPDLTGFLHSYKCTCVNQPLSQQPLSGEDCLSLFSVPRSVLRCHCQVLGITVSVCLTSHAVSMNTFLTRVSHTEILPRASVLLSFPSSLSPPHRRSPGCLGNSPASRGRDGLALLFTLNKETFCLKRKDVLYPPKLE